MRDYTLDEVSFIFSVSRTTVYNWLASGLLSKQADDAAVERVFEAKEREIEQLQAELERARRRFQNIKRESLEPALV